MTVSKREDSNMLHFKSPDGYTLLGWAGKVPCLTVEIRSKWYELFVIHPDSRIESLHFGHVDDVAAADHYAKGSGYRDHVPNPVYVEALAEIRDWHLDELALELITGRWILEAS